MFVLWHKDAPRSFSGRQSPRYDEHWACWAVLTTTKQLSVIHSKRKCGVDAFGAHLKPLLFTSFVVVIRHTCTEKTSSYEALSENVCWHRAPKAFSMKHENFLHFDLSIFVQYVNFCKQSALPDFYR